jgi:hypothetical protein
MLQHRRRARRKLGAAPAAVDHQHLVHLRRKPLMDYVLALGEAAR